MKANLKMIFTSLKEKRVYSFILQWQSFMSLLPTGLKNVFCSYLTASYSNFTLRFQTPIISLRSSLKKSYCNKVSMTSSRDILFVECASVLPIQKAVLISFAKHRSNISIVLHESFNYKIFRENVYYLVHFGL